MSFTRAGLTCLLSFAVVASPDVAAADQARSAAASDPPIVHPVRRGPELLVPGLPDLPRGAEEVEPLTLEIVARRTLDGTETESSRRTIARTRDRAHMLTGETEWLFVRNPVDPRRVSAQMVDHRTRTIVLHEESDLRNTLGVRGWADVLTLGFDPGVLDRLAPASRSRTVGGIRFRKYAGAVEGQGSFEVWWNGDCLLPAAFVIKEAGGEAAIRIERLTAGVDPALIRSPATRFPDYRVVDRAEWLEGH